MSAVSQAPRTPMRSWLLLAVLTVPVFMVAIDMSILFLALPSIAADLSPSATQQLWTLHIGDLLSAGLVLTAGTLADRMGPRRLLVLGMAAYAAFSLIAANAPNAETLIFARGLIGIAAVTVTPATMVLLRHIFPSDRQFATAIAVFMAGFSGGAAFGPPFGGVLLEHFSWGAIFLANVPVGLFVMLVAPLLPSVPGKGSGRIDVLSIGLSLTAIALMVYGFQEMAANGFYWAYVVLIVSGLALGVVFVRRQFTLAEPLFDMALFKNPGFSAALAILLLALMGLGASYMQFAQYMQTVLGLSPLHAGMALTVPAAIQVASTAFSPRLLRWMRPSTAIAGGAALGVLGAATVLLGTTLEGRDALVVMIVGDSIVSTGTGPVFALSASVILASAPPERTGSASGAQEVAGSMGNAIGLVLGGSLAVIVYQAMMGAAVPEGLSAEQTGQARESVGRAVAVARQIGGPAGAELLAAAREAFISSTRAVYGYAVVLYIGFIGLTLWKLGAVRLDDEP